LHRFQDITTVTVWLLCPPVTLRSTISTRQLKKLQATYRYAFRLMWKHIVV